MRHPLTLQQPAALPDCRYSESTLCPADSSLPPVPLQILLNSFYSCFSPFLCWSGVFASCLIFLYKINMQDFCMNKKNSRKKFSCFFLVFSSLLFVREITFCNEDSNWNSCAYQGRFHNAFAHKRCFFGVSLSIIFRAGT